MQIIHELTEDIIDQLAKKYKLLGNPKHLQLLLILDNKSQTLDEIHEELHKKQIYLHRESTYKVVEKMVEVGLIKKEYDQTQKKFFYNISNK